MSDDCPKWLIAKVEKAKRRMRKVAKELPMIVKHRVEGRMAGAVIAETKRVKKCKRNSLINRTKENDAAANAAMKWTCRNYVGGNL